MATGAGSSGAVLSYSSGCMLARDSDCCREAVSTASCVLYSAVEFLLPELR